MNVKHIDIWILDTEGAEESVLRGTDFNEVFINAVAMECDEHVSSHTTSLTASFSHSIGLTICRTPVKMPVKQIFLSQTGSNAP